jgi:hypothetical protein
MSEADRVTSIRQAAAVCNVSPPVVRRWLSLGLMPRPPWTVQLLTFWPHPMWLSGQIKRQPRSRHWSLGVGGQLAGQLV